MGKQSGKISADITKYYRVEEGIPMPRARENILRRGRFRFPFADMRVGDSFLCPAFEEVRAIYTAIRNLKRRLGVHWEFTLRRMPDGNMRVWRTK